MSQARSVLFTLLIVALATPIAGCGSDDGALRTNQAPVVSLSGSPPEGRDTFYEVRLSWTGSDPDGSILRYEYAADPPAVFSEDEINHGGPGITTTYVVPEGNDPGAMSMPVYGYYDDATGETFPWTIKTQRIAPGEKNTWYIEVLGTKASVRFSTKNANHIRLSPLLHNSTTAAFPVIFHPRRD